MTQKQTAEVPAKVKPAPKTIVHSGHRERLRERARKTGLDGLAAHEVLELLLTYCIPRVDVNEQAHALLDTFGSLSGVLDAPEEKLCRVKGIGPEAARFLKTFPQVFRLYAMDKGQPINSMNTAERMCAYLQNLYVGETNEKVYLLLFDNAMRLVSSQCMGEGTVNSVQVPVRKIVEEALFKGASCAVLAHNHPDGLPIPSEEDLTFTDAVNMALDLLGIPLVEHFLVTERQCVPIVRRRRGLLRSSPKTGELDEGFWRNFYGE